MGRCLIRYLIKRETYRLAWQGTKLFRRQFEETRTNDLLTLTERAMYSTRLNAITDRLISPKPLLQKFCVIYERSRAKELVLLNLRVGFPEGGKRRNKTASIRWVIDISEARCIYAQFGWIEKNRENYATGKIILVPDYFSSYAAEDSVPLAARQFLFVRNATRPL